MKKLKAAIVGASGYAGGELIRILQRHPSVALDRLFAHSSAGTPVRDIHPWSASNDAFEAMTEEVPEADICFLALPHGEAVELAPRLLEQNKIVIDLSGDHRLKSAELNQRFYGKTLASPVAEQAVYGLPEWSRAEIRGARFISNPGCYATSAILALAPLVKAGLIETTGIVINSLSGVSGAGRKAAIDLSFAEVNETVKAYKVGEHQHQPEIEKALSALSGSNVQVTFTPHLIPITRGIYSTINAKLSPRVTEDEVAEAFKTYDNAAFVRHSMSRIPEIRAVHYTNYIDIGIRVLADRGEVIVMSTIDNLVKGAAGQAVQNMNIVCGFEEREGLL